MFFFFNFKYDFIIVSIIYKQYNVASLFVNRMSKIHNKLKFYLKPKAKKKISL